MSTLTIYPYLIDQTWVFDDERTSLKEEAFVLGMSEMISRLVEQKGIPDAKSRYFVPERVGVGIVALAGSSLAGLLLLVRFNFLPKLGCAFVVDPLQRFDGTNQVGMPVCPACTS